MEARKLILYKYLAAIVQARLNCAQRMDTHAEWFAKHTEQIRQIVSDMMPSGSGWDHGTQIDLDASHGDKLVFRGSYHHMNDGGMYDGWTDHTVTVKPSLQFGYSIRVSGPNRNEIEDYLVDMFAMDLETEMVWDGERWRNAKFVGMPEVQS
jgi:hypothetical protein